MTTKKRPSAIAARRAAARDEKAALKANRPKRARGSAALDSFQNFGLQLGIGTGNALSGSSYGFHPITRVRTLLEWIYRGTWIGGVAVNLRAEDMTRAGVQLNTTMPPEDGEKLLTSVQRNGAWRGMRDTKKWASLYGGAIGVVLIRGQDVETPLRPETVGRGDFVGMTVLDRWMVDPTISAGGLVEELGPNLGKPKFYNIRSDAAMLPGRKVHFSRCLRLLGDEMPYWQSVMENLWGTSIYERIYDRLVAFDSATQGAAQSVYKSSIRTYQIEKLRELVTTGGKAYEGLLRYVNMMRTFQGIEGITLIDAKDTFVTHTPNIQTGVAEALVQFGQQLCGALRYPAVRLFGMSPAGLNATGDSDWRNYYDSVNQDQETDLRMFVDLILRIAAASEGLKLPEGFSFKFTSLWQMTEQQKAEVAERKTGTIIAAKADGLYGRGTALKELRQQSSETGVHTNITDDDIEEAEEEDEMNPPGLQELAGASPGAGGPAPGPGEGNPRDPRLLPSGEPESGLRESGAALRGLKSFGGDAGGGWIDNRFDVRCGAVADRRGRGVYIHWAMPRYSDRVPKRDGAPLDIWTALFHHEMDERDAMYEEGMSYPTAHRKRGTPAERAYVEGQGADWKEYTAVVAGELAKIEHMPVRNPPPDPHVSPDAATCHGPGAKDAALPLVDVGGMPVLIECRKGEERWPGKVWPADYGYVRRTASAEGPDEATDCFVGDSRDAATGYVINHYGRDGTFEEHKIFFCYPDAQAAIRDYKAAYQDCLAKRPEKLTAFERPLSWIRDWLARGDFARPMARAA